MEHKKWKWAATAALTVMLILPVAVHASQTKETKSGALTSDAFAKKLEKELKLTDFTKAVGKQNDPLTREKAAVLAAQADQQLNQTNVDEAFYQKVVNRKRISDLAKVKSKNRPSVVYCFQKGILVGKSNGMYSQSRKFEWDKQVGKKEASTIIARIKNSAIRKKVSPDGQVIRTNKLPKNYKDFPYILESFPNGFYEKKFHYQKVQYSYKPKELKDYASPAKIKQKQFKTNWGIYKMSDILDENLDRWADKVEINLKTRLSFDYKKSGTAWINNLRKTYYLFGEADQDKGQTEDIKSYVKKARKNKVTLKVSKVRVEPSTVYYDTTCGYFIRAYVKFKVESATKLYAASSSRQNELIYGMNIYLTSLKKKQWYEGYFDVALSTSNGSSLGADYAVFWDMMTEE